MASMIKAKSHAARKAVFFCPEIYPQVLTKSLPMGNMSLIGSTVFQPDSRPRRSFRPHGIQGEC